MIMYDNINMISCGMTNCYVIRGEKGDVLIDTGREEYRNYIETWLLNYDIKLIILTHGHADHVQNAGYFSELYGAPVMMNPRDLPLAKDNSCRSVYITNPWGHILKKENEKLFHMKMNHFELKIPVTEGESLSEYGIDGFVIELEGHTRGSIGIFCKSSAGFDLYAGDAVMNTPLPMFPMIAESPKRARESIERIVTLSPDRIMPGHGQPIVCGSKAYQMFIGRF